MILLSVRLLASLSKQVGTEESAITMGEETMDGEEEAK
jgi:hypothetical protein